MSKKLTKREIVLMTITLIFLVTMGFFKFLYLPEYARYQAILQEYDSYDTEVKILRTEKTSELTSDLVKKKQSLEDITSFLGMSKSDDELEKELREVLETHGYTLDTFYSVHRDDEMLQQVKDGLHAVGVRDFEIAGTGVYANLPDILEDLGNLKGYALRGLGVSKRRVSTGSGNTLLSANLDSSNTKEEYTVYFNLSYLYEVW